MRSKLDEVNSTIKIGNCATWDTEVSLLVTLTPHLWKTLLAFLKLLWYQESKLVITI